MLQGMSTRSPARSRRQQARDWEPERMARGKASVDASELEKLEWPYDWPPPWRSRRLLGHEPAEQTMLAAQQSGRLHHAWLMAGPRGIGKATLAWRFARFLLCGQQQGGLFGAAAEGLDVAADAPGRSLVDARSHPDLFHLRRTLNPDTGRMRAEIAVDDVRALGAFMHMTPAMGKWRVAMARLHGFAERFARRGEEANAAWRSLNYLFDGWLKGLARRAALGPEGGREAAPVVPSEGGLHARLLAATSLDRWIEAWEKTG